jgi:hypothetical protein
VSNRSPDAAFEICMQSIRASLEETEVCVGKLFVAAAGGTTKSELLLEIGRLDILIRQKVRSRAKSWALPFSRWAQVDQIQSLFVTQPNDAPAVKLSDPRARSLWINAFGGQVRMVPWGEFLPVLLSASGGGGDVGVADVATLRQFVDFTLDGWVSVYEFEVFLLSFAPLPGCVARVLDAFNAGLLAGYLSSVEANAALVNREPGSYLIRFSKSNPGAFAVTFVDSKSRVKHCLLYNARPYGVTLKEPPDVFPTLAEFVRSHGSRLKHPLGAQVRRVRPTATPEIVALTPTLATPYSQSLSQEAAGGVITGVAGNAYSMDGIEFEEKERMCVVCMAKPVSTCFIPCGHVCCCQVCSGKLQSLQCPVCRAGVSKVQAIFIV